MFNVQLSGIKGTAARLESSSLTPNWNEIPSRGMARPDDQELIAEIKELAVKEAKAVNEKEIRALEKPRAVLLAQYVSPVSPDRKGLYNQAVAAVNRKKSDGTLDLGSKTLVDFLMQEKGINVSVSDMTIKKIEIGGVDVLYNFGVGIGWTYESTPAELSKQMEFANIYSSAYDEAKRSMGIESNRANEMRKHMVDTRV